MVLKQIRAFFSQNIILCIFGFIFSITIVFYLALLIGLFTYSDCDAIISLLKNEEFIFALKLTLWTSITATILALIVALPCGYILSRYNFIGLKLMDSLLDIPIMMPPLISGVALLILFGPILGNHFSRIGLDIVFTPIGVVIAQWFIATPYAIKIFKQTFLSVDTRMENIARTLGYSPLMVFFKVTMPLSKKGFGAAILMSWTRALGEFGATAMLAGTTRMKTETLSIAIFLNMSIGDMKFAISTAIFMVIVALILMTVLKIFFRDEVNL